jgi:hypothetical protein
MPRKCKHENADHLMPGESFAPFVARPRPYVLVTCEQFRCVDCGAWLPLGPSKDQGVEHEIRAAEIAANLAGKGCTMSSLEISGFNDEPMRLRNGVPILLDTAAQQAGRLARVIATHGADQ